MMMASMYVPWLLHGRGVVHTVRGRRSRAHESVRDATMVMGSSSARVASAARFLPCIGRATQRQGERKDTVTEDEEEDDEKEGGVGGGPLSGKEASHRVTTCLHTEVVVAAGWMVERVHMKATCPSYAAHVHS